MFNTKKALQKSSGKDQNLSKKVDLTFVMLVFLK